MDSQDTQSTPLVQKNTSTKMSGWKSYSNGAKAAIITFSVLLGLVVIGVVILTVFLVIGNNKSSSSVGSLVAARPVNKTIVRKPVNEVPRNVQSNIPNNTTQNQNVQQQVKTAQSAVNIAREENTKTVSFNSDNERTTSTQSRVLKSVQNNDQQSLADITKQSTRFRELKNEKEEKNISQSDSDFKIKPMSNRNKFD